MSPDVVHGEIELRITQPVHGDGGDLAGEIHAVGAEGVPRLRAKRQHAPGKTGDGWGSKTSHGHQNPNPSGWAEGAIVMAPARGREGHDGANNCRGEHVQDSVGRLGGGGEFMVPARARERQGKHVKMNKHVKR